MLYYLTKKDQVFYEQRARWSFLSEERMPGWVRLFNKNAGSTLHARVVRQVPNRAEYIVEVDNVPDYFLNVLRPVTE